MKEEKEEEKDAEIKRGRKQQKETGRGRDGNERRNKEKRIENNLK